MRRREFITLTGSAAAWPLAARAQQGRQSVVGVLRVNAKDAEVFAEPFRRYMQAIGWEEGRNIRFNFVWAEGHIERAPALASELVAQNVDVIVTSGDAAIRADHSDLSPSLMIWSAVGSWPAWRDPVAIPPA
jgi:putative ABC transport system substrate-binding protein